MNYPVPSDPFPLSSAEKRLAREMVRYWTNFVATLDPNRSGLGPQMPEIAGGEERYGTDRRAYDSAVDNFQALIPPYPHPEFDFAAEHQCGFWQQLGLESGL